MTLLCTNSGHDMIADTLAHFGPVPGPQPIQSAAAAAVPPARNLPHVMPRMAGAPLFIGIAGPKRAGKDTLAAGLANAYGLARDSFAAPLRRFVASILGMSPDSLEAAKEQPVAWLADITPRAMMQTVGTEWGRETVHPELWVRSLFARMPAGGIITDVRFPNEAKAIRERGGIVIRVTRPGYGEGDSHASEKPLPASMVDVEVCNEGTPHDLVQRALHALQRRAVN